MIKLHFFMYGSMILATMLGVYAQSISYYINSNIVKISPLYSLTVLTMISILLYTVPPMFAYKFINKQQNGEASYVPHIYINSLLGVSISVWSLFVLIMWWG
ncbi:MAG: hypothetical protein K0R93_1031 [Anaerosolibacter sp.]|jgi:hypothetical protein|nr:hypothetical protein [Anaerosolibacter sp.]